MKKFNLEELQSRVAKGENVKLKTKAGQSVRLIATDAKGNYPIVGLLKDSNGNEYPNQWTVVRRCLCMP